MDFYRSKKYSFRNATATGILVLAASVLGFTALPVPTAHAQTLVSGDVTGTVTDSSGASIPNVQVQLKSLATGETRTANTSASGAYRVPFVKPGQYSVTATLAGFQTTTTQVNVSAGQVADGSLRMAVGTNATTIEVTEAAPLLHTEDAAINTTFDMQAVQQLPNPGNDVTFVAQTAPGSVMNTQGGYGNFSSFGLPATSNTFTLNGSYENDPYLNLNNSGATNLLLGNNDVSSVSVTSPAYDASFGGLGGAQVNQISRSGANRFHGNAGYWWNGRAMNANDWFNNHAPAGQQTPRQFVNANQWAAAIGGPILHDKTFFFINTEGLRVIIPSRATVYAPSPAYQATTLANVAAAYPSEVPQYQRIFNLYNSAPGASSAVPDTSGDPDVVNFNGTASSFAKEWLLSGRIDQNLSQNDRLFGHFKLDKGVQPTFVSVLNPLFNVFSPQPSYEGQLNETHSFSPNVTNQFVFAAAYYRAIFTNTSQAAANAVVPFTLVFLDGSLASNGTASLPGGANYDFPQGRNVTGYQFIDDLSITHGAHTIKVGWAIRRDNITDYGPSVRAITPEAYATEASFGSGLLTRFRQQFPQRTTNPVSVYGMGGYVQDAWKAAPNLTLTLGLRLEHNSNPVCHTNCFANLSSEFQTLAASTSGDTPYNQLIDSGLDTAYPSQQTLAIEPRFGFAYSVGSKTTVRGGFGMFADTFPGQVAGSLMNNAPSNIGFYLRGKYSLDPTLSDSGQQAVAASNQAFRTGYANGASFNSLSAAGIGFAAPAFTSTVHKINIPTYEFFTLGFERQIDSHTVVAASYVGNHGYHMPYVN
ncbi:MAG: carboxypeptidase-like regulatory domain-containing protein, partial [Acidobacteriaceae bacterium]